MTSAVQRAEDSRRKRQKDKLKQDAAKSYYSSVKGYKGKGGQQNPKAKSYKEKMADEKRANIREAARGKMTLKQSKVAGKLVNLNKKVKELKKQIQTLSKGRK